MKKEEEQIHRHGGTPQFDLERLNLAERPILDFSVNLNPLGPPPIISEHWPDLIGGIEKYPNLDGMGLAAYYERKFGIPPENFLAGNGSTEMIYLLPRALRFKRVVIVTPSYHDYRRSSVMAGAEVVDHPLGPETKFSLMESSLKSSILQKADAIWIGNPNNPTGCSASKDFIITLAEQYPEKWIIIDEAFMGFNPEKTRCSLIRPQKKPNLLVIHSLTKFYALPGIRMGGVSGEEQVIERLRKSKEPWTVNSIAERIAPLLIDCEEYDQRTRLLIQTERKRLFGSLSSIQGIVPYPSSANFILCQWQKTSNLDDLLRHLLSMGIYVRDCRNFRGLAKNFFRLAVRLPEDNNRLIEALSIYPGRHHE